ncbi:MAG TPA: MoxR family ATPase [Kofleriaceae bacterium]|nr:MoxR family ATPase [Kofleriaceae bacterium]
MTAGPPGGSAGTTLASGSPGSSSSSNAAAPAPLPASVDALIALLATQRYLADASLGTVLFLALRLGKPVLLEGEAGVGKTEVAKTLAAALGRRLIRLQCYEGLDVSSALYEWDFARQMLEIRLAEAAGPVERAQLATTLYSDRFLLRRPLLDALSPDPAGAPVLLIDELDRTDEPFEAFLLEILSDFQVSIPELGTVRAPAPPIVILTSNRTREIHDALKRRCLYHWIDYPDAARELAILTARAPDVPPRLAAQIVAFVQKLRASDLFKLPGVAETLDWGQALVALGCVELDPATVEATLGVLLKYQDDLARITGAPARGLVEAARDAGA